MNQKYVISLELSKDKVSFYLTTQDAIESFISTTREEAKRSELKEITRELQQIFNTKDHTSNDFYYAVEGLLSKLLSKENTL